MRIIVVLCVLLSFLFLSCGGDYTDSSDKRIRIGNNGRIKIDNILDYDNYERHTEYGFSAIHFKSEDSVFAIISVPANEKISTYITAVIMPEKRSPKIILAPTRNNNEYSVFLNGSKENREILTDTTNQLSYEIGIQGTFSPYSQECLNFISSGEYSDIQSESMKNLHNSKENSVYVIPYPWREIKVKVEGNLITSDTSAYQEAINWANENVFKQAICSLAITTNEKDADCSIFFDQDAPKNIVFLDESGKEYDINSGRIASAHISPGPYRKKCFSYAVAYLMGVSPDNSQFNLMVPEDNNEEHVHLTFRQWNQLHAIESGK